MQDGVEKIRLSAFKSDAGRKSAEESPKMTGSGRTLRATGLCALARTDSEGKRCWR